MPRGDISRARGSVERGHGKLKIRSRVMLNQIEGHGSGLASVLLSCPQGGRDIILTREFINLRLYIFFI